MAKTSLLTVGVACVAALYPTFSSAAEPAVVVATAAQCNALLNANLLGTPDAPTQITGAKLVEPAGIVSGYCEVQGYVWPQVGFELLLPVSNWNGKFIELGCGGHCGVIELSIADCPAGYACIGTDAGHKATVYEGQGLWGGDVFDGLWGYGNLQAKVDWGYRAPHVTAVAGKAITALFYHQAPKKSYFMGCSTGGRQGLQEAQRFPWDFDGIIAGAPPINLSTLYMTFAWGILATHDKDGRPLLGKAELKLVTDAAVAKCDLDDGVGDGIISDPKHCRFDPAKLTCKANQTSRCLTQVQVEAVKKVYAGPTTSSGVSLSLGGPMPGSEYGLVDGAWGVNDWSEAYVGINGKRARYEPLVTAGLRYLFFVPDLGPAWKLSDFDFDRDYQNMGVAEALYDSSNPDLRKFKAAGGKLISYQGTNDISVLPQITEDYYDTVERTMGGREATQSFFRLFVFPGAEHCLIGGDGADTVNFLAVLEDWVENGKAPDRLIAAHLKNGESSGLKAFPLDPSRIQFTRPVYPYPIGAKYSGHGDPNNAANFVPAAR